MVLISTIAAIIVIVTALFIYLGSRSDSPDNTSSSTAGSIRTSSDRTDPSSSSSSSSSPSEDILDDLDTETWIGVLVDAFGTELDIREAYAKGSTIELRPNGNCILILDGEILNGTWTGSGSRLTVKIGEAEYPVTIDDDALLFKVMDDIYIIYTKDGNAPANRDSASTSASPSQQPAASPPTSALTDEPTLASSAAKRAEEAYAFAADLALRASVYNRNAALYRYTLNCQDPAGSAPAAFLTAWSDAVLVATEGAVDIEVGVSNAFCAGGSMVALDDMKAGLIDFVWTLPSYYRGYMPLTLAIQNPALGIKNSTVGSFAMWELYKVMPEIQREIADHGELMFLWANNPSPLSYNGSAEITSIGDINGNVRGNNGPAQLFITEVGASVFGCPIGDVYPNVHNGVLDFLIADWHTIASFKLADPGVLNFYLDTNIGCSAYVLIANSDSWARIEYDGYSEAIRSVSGDYCLNLVGIWEDYEARGRSDALNNGGTIFAPNPTLAAELQTAYDNVGKQWVAETGGAAQAVYDKAAELAAHYNAIYG